ncbi:hypothetical protein [Rhizobium leguminosarum]|uniref:hypothetical protein n=1 Tax=Rhizobium leguminosarum TaxID=384 RepID=UPI001FE18981|nr:hypothetical protein [Rhizobium leguminosarum]
MLSAGQLAVDHSQVGRGIGMALVKDAFRRCIAGADLVGGRAIVARAVDEESERFWQSWCFIPRQPVHPSAADYRHQSMASS